MVTHLSTNNDPKVVIVVTHLSTNIIHTFDFQDINGDDCDKPSTLIYTKDPYNFINNAVEKRKLVKPFASLGWDGGQDKLLLVLQLHDLANPDPTLWKDGGRRRSIILARGNSILLLPQ